MKCPICGKEVGHHIEFVNFEWVEVWSLACNDCLGIRESKKNNKKRIA